MKSRILRRSRPGLPRSAATIAATFPEMTRITISIYLVMATEAKIDSLLDVRRQINWNTK